MENDKYLNDFIDYLVIEKKLSNNTINSYKYDLIQFIDFIKGKSLIKIEKSDITDYLAHLNKKDESSKTTNRHLTSLRQLYKYLSFSELFENPTTYFKSLKTEKSLPHYLSVEEVDKLLNVELKTKYDYRNKAILELMYATGLRISEVVDLELSNIDFENCILKTVGKGNKERIIPIGSVALQYLNTYLNIHRGEFKVKGKVLGSKIFVSYRGEGITRHGINKILNDLKEKAGLDKYLTPHVLRHSFATHLVENGADIRIVQELMGHENIETTEIYTHLSNRYIEDKYKESHPRGRKDERNV